jgi:hypothetical protein
MVESSCSMNRAVATTQGKYRLVAVVVEVTELDMAI